MFAIYNEDIALAECVLCTQYMCMNNVVGYVVDSAVIRVQRKIGKIAVVVSSVLCMAVCEYECAWIR